MEGFNMEGMSTQAQQIWSMLDDMVENNPAAYRKFIEKQMKEGKEQMSPPDPHMCVQVSLLTKPHKPLFVNFCSWKKIPEPKSPEDPVPVNGTPITHEVDDTGKFCLTSVAFNPKVLEEFGREAKNPADGDTLIQLALDYIEHEQKVKVSRSYTVLPKDTPLRGELSLVQMSFSKLFNKPAKNSESEKDIDYLEKCFQTKSPQNQNKDSLLSQLSNISVGDTQNPQGNSSSPQPPVNIFSDATTKKSKKGLIEEIGASKLPESKSPLSKLPAPEYSMETTDLDSGRTLVLVVNLPDVTSVSECELDISQDDVELTVPGRYELMLKLPSIINEDLARAKFSKKMSTLTLTMPCTS